MLVICGNGFISTVDINSFEVISNYNINDELSDLVYHDDKIYLFSSVNNGNLAYYDIQTDEIKEIESESIEIEKNSEARKVPGQDYIFIIDHNSYLSKLYVYDINKQEIFIGLDNLLKLEFGLNSENIWFINGGEYLLTKDGDIYNTAVIGASAIPTVGWVIGGAALTAEGISYLTTGQSISENINDSVSDNGTIDDF